MNTDKHFTMSLRKIYPEMVVHKLPSVTREYKVYGKKRSSERINSRHTLERSFLQAAWVKKDSQQSDENFLVKESCKLDAKTRSCLWQPESEPMDSVHLHWSLSRDLQVLLPRLYWDGQRRVKELKDKNKRKGRRYHSITKIRNIKRWSCYQVQIQRCAGGYAGIIVY